MSTESTTKTAGSFTIGSEIHQFDAIISRKIVPGDGPEDPTGYMVTFLPHGAKEYVLAWVDYQTYSALQPYAQAYLAQLNHEADAEG